jgi:large subunit ribosomal protein L23
MKTAHDIIIRPIVSERTMSGTADHKYTFEVASQATKIDVRNAVEEVFGVKVDSVNIMNVRGKKKRLSMGRPEGYTPAWKKAIVKLKKDSKTIEFFDSLM